MSARQRIAVLMGGMSSEHEVSLVSGRAIVAGLRERFDVLAVGIGRDGRWCQVDVDWLLEQEAAVQQWTLPAEARAVEWVTGSATPLRDAHTGVAIPVDVVFPCIHGPGGEDGSLQGLLQLSGLPYVGAGILGASAGMDKAATKALLRSAGLPCADFQTLRFGDWQQHRAQHIERLCSALPVFVKPCNMGSSVGVSRADCATSLAEALDVAFAFDAQVLIEQAIDGAREIELAVMGNDTAEVSVAGEIIASQGFYDYADKYLLDQAQLIIPASLTDDQLRQLQDWAVQAYQALRCRGMARVDFLLRDHDAYIIEINTHPGFTPISMYPKLWEASGRAYPDLLSELVSLACEEAGERARHQLQP